MKENVERVIDSLFDDYLEEFRAEHSIDDSFLTIYKDHKAVYIEALSESLDENVKRFLQYLYENQNGILECREHMKKITHKVRIK